MKKVNNCISSLLAFSQKAGVTEKSSKIKKRSVILSAAKELLDPANKLQNDNVRFFDNEISQLRSRLTSTLDNNISHYYCGWRFPDVLKCSGAELKTQGLGAAQAKFLFILILSLTSFTFLFAQNPPQEEVPHALKMISRGNDAQVKLRWAPTTFKAWQEVNEAGYVVVRHTIVKNGDVLDFSIRSKGELLTPTPLKPWQGADQWRPLMERNDFAAIAAQALYGENFEPVTGSELTPEQFSNQVSSQENRFGFALFAADHSFEVAEAMGLGMIDKSIVIGESYLYRVYPASPTSTAIDTGFTYMTKSNQYTLPKILEVEAEFADKQATISWNKELFNQFYVSHIIEKSEDGVAWKPIHEQPYVNPDQSPRGDQYAFIVDTFSTNNRPYFYRVSGHTAFDEVGPPSDAVQGMGVDPMPDFYPGISQIIEMNAGQFNIQWNFDKGEEDKIMGYHLKRAPDDQGPYTIVSDSIISPSMRSYTDSNPLPTNYYIVAGIDQYGRELESFPALAQLSDSIPPAPPQNVRGKIMNDGKIVITWDKNNEPDFYGNRVWLSNSEFAEFSQLTSEATTTGYYIDTVTLNTLTENVFIKVTSQDYRHNVSDFSEIAKIARPDTVAPSAPLFTAFETSSEWIELEWANSPSTDLQRTDLRRREKGNNEWETVHSFEFPQDANVESFIDTTGQIGKIYEYVLTAVDDADLSTDSKPLELELLEIMVKEPIEGIEIVADRRAKTINLNWTYPQEKGLSYFKIYRAFDDHPMLSYETISLEDATLRIGKKDKQIRFQYTDEDLKMNTNYAYVVKAMYENGAQSKRSESISIDY